MQYINQVEPLITDADRAAVNEYLLSGGWLTEHKHTRELEEKLAEFLEVRYCSIVPNGTIGLYLAIRSLVGVGSYVAVPAYTMVATINAVLWAGAIPILIDIDPATGCMDLDLIKGVPVSAIVYVEINGRSGDIENLLQRQRGRGALLIEDSCQALGSKYKNKFMGTFGDAGVYSFSPHKLITTGQGGAIVTNSETLHKRIKKLRDFGREKAGVDWHTNFGLNFKFTDLQAVIGKSQLADISNRAERKKYIFERFRSGLPTRFELLPLREGNVPWFVDLLCKDQEERDALAVYLKAYVIGTREFYPPLYSQPYLAQYKYDKMLEAKRFSGRGLWLPSSLSLTDQQIDYILDRLHKF